MNALSLSNEMICCAAIFFETVTKMRRRFQGGMFFMVIFVSVARFVFGLERLFVVFIFLEVSTCRLETFPIVQFLCVGR